ncbi:hypothetical protein WME90_41000 [Sorangium sp. So ce375]|uniref:hypothetical protein n=1 Tax=Sorangium sp. So ce375 TaxID=3133306 RepID=UPI003F5C967B
MSCSSLDLEFAAWKIRAQPRPSELVVSRDSQDLEVGSIRGRQMFLGPRGATQGRVDAVWPRGYAAP